MHDLNDMMLFADVIEHGGFAAAGRALGLPKSRLSRRVARLEQQLGVQLLQRSTRTLTLTAAGERFLHHCEELRETARVAFEDVAEAQGEARGTVRLSCPVTLAQTALGPLLPVFLERCPRVRLDVQVLNRAVDPVEDGVDLALRVRPEIEDSATLVAKTLGTSRTALLASPTLLARQGPVRGPADLARLDTLAMSQRGERESWRLLGPQGQAFTHVHEPRIVIGDLSTLVHAAVAGTGATLLPDYLSRADLEAGRLVEVLPGWGAPPAIVHVVFPARRARVPAVRALIDFLAEHLTAEIARELGG